MRVECVCLDSEVVVLLFNSKDMSERKRDTLTV